MSLFANLNRITDINGQTVCLISSSSWTGFHHVTIFSVCVIAKGAPTEDGYLSITAPRPHPLSSSERCISLLISSTCQKLGEHLLGQTATLLNKDTVVINNQPFSSSLFGLTRPCIRPSTYLLAASLLQASTSFGP